MQRTSNRRDFLLGTLAAAGAGLVPRAWGQALTSSSAPAKRPNVLFLIVDDLRPLLGCYGNKAVLSPNMDRLAAEGLRFDRAYCQYPVCGPSRNSVLTGLRPDTSGIYGFENGDSKVPGALVLPQHFKNHGYVTGRFGKVFNNPLDFKQAWDEKPFRENRPGHTWRSEHYGLEANKVLAEKNQNPVGSSSAPACEAGALPDEAYIDGWVAAAGIDFMKRHKDQPFFLAVGLVKPHLPFACPKKYWDLYDPARLPQAANPHFPAHILEFMGTNSGELRAYGDMPKEGPIDQTLARKLTHGYYASTTFSDAQVGKLLAALKDLGLEQDTIVVLWGDNGFHLGENGLWAKHVNWELTNRLPLILKLPGMKTAGRSCPALVEFTDIYPTLCELAGLPAPAHCEGRSLRPLVADPVRPWAAAAFSQYLRGAVMSYSMRTDRYRYSEWVSRGKPDEVKGRELYDLEKDPQGNINLADDPTYVELIPRLSAQLRAGWKAAGPP